MSNEQTALMLRLIAEKVRSVAERAEGYIIEGARTQEYKWMGEGNPPPFRIPFIDDPNWQMQDTDEFAAVALITDLANELDVEAAKLVLGTVEQR